MAKLEALLLTTGRATGRAAILIGPKSISMLIRIYKHTRNDSKFEFEILNLMIELFELENIDVFEVLIRFKKVQVELLFFTFPSSCRSFLYTF